MGLRWQLRNRDILYIHIFAELCQGKEPIQKSQTHHLDKLNWSCKLLCHPEHYYQGNHESWIGHYRNNSRKKQHDKRDVKEHNFRKGTTVKEERGELQSVRRIEWDGGVRRRKIRWRRNIVMRIKLINKYSRLCKYIFMTGLLMYA